MNTLLNTVLNTLLFALLTLSCLSLLFSGGSCFAKGNTHLGGEDFDQRLMEFCISKFKRESGIDVSNDKRAVQRLRKQCEMAKRTLSTQTSCKNRQVEQTSGLVAMDAIYRLILLMLLP